MHYNHINDSLERQGKIFKQIYTAKDVPLLVPLESTSTGRGPINYPTTDICNSHNGVVEICLNMNNAFWASTFHGISTEITLIVRQINLLKYLCYLDQN